MNRFIKKKRYFYCKILLCILLSFILIIGCTMKSSNSFYKDTIGSYSQDNAYLKGLSGSVNVLLEKVVRKLHLSGKGIPVLMYHCIGDDASDAKELYVSPSEFKKQLEYIKSAGYTPIDFRQAVNPKGVKKPVIITFDDGYADNYINAFPLLKEYNFKATIFLISDAIGKKKFLGIPDIQKMQSLIDFQSHSVMHPYLSDISLDKVDYEVRESQRAIEHITGKPVFVFAYPFGNYNQNVVNIVKKYYKYALTTEYGVFYRSFSNAYEIKRKAVLRSTSMKQFVDELKST